MIKTSRQLKDLIRNLSAKKKTEPLVLMRNYMMERFIERLSKSKHKDQLILKGGMLITAMVGLDTRTTMDLDTTIKGVQLNLNSIEALINDIISVDVDDGVSFRIKAISEIMEEADYPGLRVSLEAHFDGVRTPLKIDFSTGDIITPREVAFDFPLLFENRNISVLAYPLETVLAEKLETILSRSITNTRMRDLYDVYILMNLYRDKLNPETLKQAFLATAKKRGFTVSDEKSQVIINAVETDSSQQVLWASYQKKFNYAENVDWSDVISALRELIRIIK